MTTHDQEYYRARLDAEREAIENAGSEKARKAHQELADHYEKLLRGKSDANESRPKLLLIRRPETRPQA